MLDMYIPLVSLKYLGLPSTPVSSAGCGRFNSEVLGLLSDNIFLRSYLPGQCIFRDGDQGEFIYILMRGRVEVQSQGAIEIEGGPWSIFLTKEEETLEMS